MFIAVLFAINFLIGQDCEEGSQWVETNDGHFECCPSANYMFDCDGNCYHISFYANFLGDGGCNMGKNTPNLNCEDYNLDDGDCIRDEHCGDGEVDDCADDDCCPENWIADGYPDCEDQQWGCDLTCYQNDGGDCGPLCEDEVECWDGSCAAYEDSCPVFGCEEGYLPDCSGDEVCCPESLSGCSTSTCDLTCYSEECLTGPDLVVDQATLLNSIYTSTINVSEDDCYIEENCVTGSGLRDLIRFTTEIGNIGNADFYLGPSGSSDDWEWAPCHGHWHFEQYAQYALYSYEETSPGQYDCTDQEIGHKNGWCVMDLADYTNDGTCQFQYGCSNMGISAGCSDIYNSGLDCQWLDITGIPDGEYILSVGTNVNMDHDLIHELNYDNNTANVRITLAGGNVSVGDIFDLNNCNGEVCEEEVDCAGVCGGDAVLSGCDNACNSTAVVDACGTCDSDSSNDCVQDCAGTWGGDAVIDECDVCGGDNTSCQQLGDINGDGTINVIDIVMAVDLILSNNYDVVGDVNEDGQLNVLDIVTLANCVLAGTCGGRIDDAIESRLIMVDNVVSIEADGFIGGVQMTLTHGADFSIEMTDRALYSNYVTEGNETRLLVITPETEDLFSYNGDFEIAEIIVANSYAEVSVDIPLAASFSLSEAYPNPFNPTTTMKLTMPVAGDMQVAVYNLLGQVVVTLASGYMEASTYTLTWDAADVASGMYFVKAQADGFTTTQKLMLVK